MPIPYCCGHDCPIKTECYRFWLYQNNLLDLFREGIYDEDRRLCFSFIPMEKDLDDGNSE